MNYYDRYKKLIENGQVKKMPFIKLTNRSTDKNKVWKATTDRMDFLSSREYGNGNFGWLIMMANPQYSDEFEIPDGVFIRVPYPLNAVIQEYIDKMNQYDNRFGI